MQALIFAAGLGTRLRPYTDNRPKALVPVGGTPLLGHCLRRLAAAGCTRAVVNVHYFADQIEDYLSATDFGMDIFISDEREELLETGGGLMKARYLLRPDEPFIVHNVDIVTSLDLAAFLTVHRQSHALVTLAVRRRETSRYLLFNEQNQLCGWTNTRTGQIRPPGLEADGLKKLALSGIYACAPRIFDFLPGAPHKFSIIDTFLKTAATGQTLLAHDHSHDQWIDVGTPAALARANELMK